jgi:hypothetical protein
MHVTLEHQAGGLSRQAKSFLGMVVLAATLAIFAVAPNPARASLNTDAQLMCTELIGFRFELPAASTPRQSLFYYRVDGGRWETTNWYYTSGLTWLMYRPGVGWQSIAPGGGFLPVYSFTQAGQHTVEGFEYRYAYGKYSWRDLGSCQGSTWEWGSGGIVFGP